MRRVCLVPLLRYAGAGGCRPQTPAIRSAAMMFEGISKRFDLMASERITTAKNRYEGSRRDAKPYNASNGHQDSGGLWQLGSFCRCHYCRVFLGAIGAVLGLVGMDDDREYHAGLRRRRHCRCIDGGPIPDP